MEDLLIESPKPTGPIDETASGEPAFAIPPAFEDFQFTLKHDGAFIAPDKLDFEISIPSQPTQASVRTIRIGDRQWFNFSEAWQEDPNPPRFPFMPNLVCRSLLSNVNLAAATGNPESLGERAARRYRIEGVAGEAASDIFGPESDMGRLLKSYDVDVWLSEPEGQLVKVESVSRASYPSGREMTMRITLEVGPYNEGGISIEPPI